MFALGCGQSASVKSDSLCTEYVIASQDSTCASDSMVSQEKMLALKYHSVRWKLPDDFNFDSLYINDIPQINPQRDGIDEEIFMNNDSLVFRAVIKGPKVKKCNLALWFDKNPVVLPKHVLDLVTSNNGVARITFKFR